MDDRVFKGIRMPKDLIAKVESYQKEMGLPHFTATVIFILTQHLKENGD